MPAKAKTRIDRDKIKAAFASVHPGVPQHERIPLMLERLVDALCDEIEGQ